MNPGGGLIEMINMRLSDTTDTVGCTLTQDAIDAGAPVDVSVVSRDRISMITVRAT